MERTEFPITSRLKQLFPRGVRAGIIFFCALFAVSLAWNAGFSVMGVAKSDVAKFVFSSFWPQMLAAQFKILVIYILTGFIIGWSAEFIALYTPFRFTGKRILWIFLVNLFFLARSIKYYPQLYSEAFYDRGGIFANLQLILTDTVRMQWINAYGKLLLLVAAAAVINLVFRYLVWRYVLLGALLLAVILNTVTQSIAPPLNDNVNVLILAVDSLRSDRMGYNGYHRNLTPNLDKLAKDGTVLHNHYSSLPRTFPAMISFLTGRLPLSHGVRNMFPGKYKRDFKGASFVESLRREGYQTSVVGDFAGDVFSRMDIGFENIRAPYFNFVTLIRQRSLEIHFFLLPYLINRPGRAVFPELKEFAHNADPFLLADETISQLKRSVKNGRFCNLTFFSTTHFPYAAPYPYYSRYTAAGYNGRYKYQKPPVMYEKSAVSDADITQIRGLYDGCVGSVDAAIGKIFSFLKENGYWDNTIIIVTADHGENLYESNWSTGHGEHLRGPNVVKVPCIIKFPKRNFYASNVFCTTRDIDIAPTLGAFFKLPRLQQVDGASLMPVLLRKKYDLGLTAFSETGLWFSDVTDGFYQEQRIMYPDVTGITRVDFTYNLEVVLKEEFDNLTTLAKHRMVDDGVYRLIYIPTRSGVSYELYNHKKDPGFKHNLVSADPGKAAELKNKLRFYMKKDPLITFKNDYALQANFRD